MAWRFRWAAPGVTIADAFPMDVVRYRSLLGASGPPYNVVSEEQPFRPGSFLKTITVDDAEVDLTMIIKGTSSQDLWSNMAGLPALFNPTRTNSSGEFGGRLLVSTPASSASRFLDCVCISGFMVDQSTLQQNMIEANLTFHANYPYWQSSQESSSAGTPFGKRPEWFPIFPLILGGLNQNFVEVTVTNNGDVPAFPTIILRGPAGNPKITNKTLPSGTGFFPLTANGGLHLQNNTQSVTIDMLNRTVVRNNGVNEVSKLALSGTFWALAPGQNTIRFNITGPPNPSGSTSITILWRDTYSTII